MGGNPVWNIDLNHTQPWPSAAAWINVFTGTFYAAATLVVAQRLLLRIFKFGSPLGCDDALIFASWLAATAFFVEGTLAINSLDYGLPVQPHKFEFIALMLWSIQIAFSTSQACIKLAVLAILNRFVKATSNTRIRYAIYGAAAFTAAAPVVFLTVSLLVCRPLEAFWRTLDASYVATHDYQCVDKGAVAIVAGTAVIIQDLYTIAIPWAISRSFGLNKRQTLALNLVFTLGLIVTVGSGVRTYYLYSVYQGGTHIPDDLVQTIVWATVEVQVAIICACLPSTRVLYRVIVGSRMSQRVHQRYFSRHGDSYNARSGASHPSHPEVSCDSRSETTYLELESQASSSVLEKSLAEDLPKRCDESCSSVSV
ncbi:unnamed protein product [Zymoseptoria tritici ST99CH_3D1]|nr:unnamed protein product [Zymoseptoria tritici ST99CH_3D1]